MAAHYEHQRFFVNKFSPALLEKEPAVDKELWRKRIKSTMEQIEQGQDITPQTCDGEWRSWTTDVKMVVFRCP
jgi:hypothetical protein